MIAAYTVEVIKGGYVARVACDWCSGFAQGRTRARAIESAAVLVLKNLAEVIDAGDVAIEDVFPIRFEEASGG